MRIIWLLPLLFACGPDDQPAPDAPPALFPDDYASTYTEVRNCRNSIDHDLMRIRVLASPEALQAYTDRTTAFPPGAIVLKEQFDDSDIDCAGPIVEITVMQKLDVPDQLGWAWQKTNAAHAQIEFDQKKCVNCHMMCGVPSEGGYDGTCTQP